MATIDVKIIDFTDNYTPRTGSATFPWVPRPGDLFQWDAQGSQLTIQQVLWNADEGSITLRVG